MRACLLCECYVTCVLSQVTLPIALTAAGALLRRAGTLLGGEAQTVSEQPPSSLAWRSYGTTDKPSIE